MIGATYLSVGVLDENYLNNQRANILFDHYLKFNEVLDVSQVNKKEIFYLPNFLNWNRTNYI
jgi:hypothetical protein